MRIESVYARAGIFFQKVAKNHIAMNERKIFAEVKYLWIRQGNQ
jgi:hypothetical protein